MEPLILAIIFISFFCTYLAVPFWIKKAHFYKLTGKDIHKNDKKEIAEGGGIVILAGTSLGILLYIALNTFYFHSQENLIKIFAMLNVLFIGSAVGIIDDFFGWKKGLSKKLRMFIVFFSAVPLMVINAGNSSIVVPFLGSLNLGLFYPLLLIPIGVVGATTTYNFIAGYNGLETSQGIIILSALAIVTYLTGNSWLSVIALFMIASLLAFYIFNKYPAEVFPGDILTYSIGGMIASITILGNIEKIAVFFFIPYIIEVGLKIRGKLEKESFAKVQKDGSLEMPYHKIYSLTHISLFILKKFKSKVYEKEVVYLINAFQIFIIALGFLVFF
ncbi:MAG: glycosyltransferase 4 family protein [archaeon]